MPGFEELVRLERERQSKEAARRNAEIRDAASADRDRHQRGLQISRIASAIASIAVSRRVPTDVDFGHFKPISRGLFRPQQFRFHSHYKGWEIIGDESQVTDESKSGTTPEFGYVHKGLALTTEGGIRQYFLQHNRDASEPYQIPVDEQYGPSGLAKKDYWTAEQSEAALARFVIVHDLPVNIE